MPMSYDAVTKVSGSHGDNSRPYKLFQPAQL